SSTNRAIHCGYPCRLGPTGRNVWNATNNVCRCDTSGHKVSFVTVEPGVQLEVLDWGGTGQTLILLTGIGDNAHVFDEFAYQFNDRFHVIGITRRGFGHSSQPVHGYDLDTRARDDITVLDKLNIREAVFIGHSVAGTELSRLGAVYPDLTETDIQACIAYGAEMARERFVQFPLERA